MREVPARSTELTHDDYWARINYLRAKLFEANTNNERRLSYVLEELIARYRRVIRMLDWLPPAEVRAQGIGRKA